MKIFVDTNVLIDFVCNRESYYEDAETVFSLALSRIAEVCFTDISIINTLYVGKKYGFTTDEISSKLIETLEYCKVSKIDNNIILHALSSQWKDKEDATQYFSAKESGVDIIVTRNVKDFALSLIKVVSPSDILQLL